MKRKWLKESFLRRKLGSKTIVAVLRYLLWDLDVKL